MSSSVYDRMVSDKTPIIGMSTEHQISPNWWRIDSPFRELNKRGYSAILQKNYEIKDVPDNSIVVWLRTSARCSLDIDEIVQKLHEKNCLIVYDADDDIFTPEIVDHVWALSGGTWSEEEQKQELGEQVIRRYIINQVDGVTVSTPGMKELLSAHCIRPVIVVPNAIDVSWFTSALDEQSLWVRNEIRIGWAGSGRPQRDLLPMAKAWGKIAELHPNVVFIVGGWRPQAIYENVPKDRIIYRPWTDIDTYPEMMQVDIGCAPLYPSKFNACKSPIKAWEYALAGAAVVASPTVYGQVIQHGWNGFLANTEEEWTYYLNLLIEDTWTRTYLGSHLRDDIHANYSMETNVYNWPMAYGEILDMKTARILRNEGSNKAVPV